MLFRRLKNKNVTKIVKKTKKYKKYFNCGKLNKSIYPIGTYINTEMK